MALGVDTHINTHTYFRGMKVISRNQDKNFGPTGVTNRGVPIIGIADILAADMLIFTVLVIDR